MNSSFYDVPLIQQGLQECAQASAAQLLNFLGRNKTIDEVKEEVPVYLDKEGQPLGTSIGHIANYFIQQGYKTTIHTTDIQLFDRSWIGKTNEELIELLQQREKYIKHPIYGADVFDVIFDGYISYLKEGGSITFPLIDETYLVKMLEKGPLFAVVSYNFLNSIPKYKYIKDENKYLQDPIQGNPTTHSIVIAGYKDNKFYIVDPDFDFGGKKWVDSGLLIASLYVAETNYDNLIISFEE
jgi:uncharacterized protein YvpB